MCACLTLWPLFKKKKLIKVFFPLETGRFLRDLSVASQGILKPGGDKHGHCLTMCPAAGQTQSSREHGTSMGTDDYSFRSSTKSQKQRAKTLWRLAQFLAGVSACEQPGASSAAVVLVDLLLSYKAADCMQSSVVWLESADNCGALFAALARREVNIMNFGKAFWQKCGHAALPYRW